MGLKEPDLRKLERKLIVSFIILGIIVIIGIIILIKNTKDKNLPADQSGTKTSQNQGLDDVTVLIPDNIKLYDQIPEFTYTNEKGEVRSINDFKGKKVIVTFWASWCPDCHQQMPLYNQCKELVDKYDNVEYILINKLDHAKETKEKAKQYLKDNKIKDATYYDDGLIAYKLLGMHNIPTTIFIDENGKVTACYPKQFTDVSVFEAYLLNTVEGSGTVTKDFVVHQMMDENGGIHSKFNLNHDITNESDILSESQGAVLEYAALNQDKELFDKTLGFIDTYMRAEGLTSWCIAQKKASKTNALIDDFRIYKAIYNANKQWGGYDSELARYEEDFKKYAISGGKYVDFYDGSNDSVAGRFTLCYADFESMSILKSKDDEFKNAYDKAVNIVNNGMISDEFPLYYSWYNYDKNRYEEDDLNMSEAMITLLHLAKADMLSEKTINWLKEQMSKEGIKARYSVKGEVVKGYNFGSTATYAILAMIADEIGDNDLRAAALEKMEIMRINNTDYVYNGAFGEEAGTGILSFDQLMPILAYEYKKK